MAILAKNIFCVCVVILIIVSPVYNAPPAKYDQKQTGENNVQVHLKDFHIIAVIGGDAWGGNGDYDINYDYSDLTVKPTMPTTENPGNLNSSEASNNINGQKPEEGAEKPNEKPDNVTMLQSSTANPPLTIPVVVISENAQPSKPEDKNSEKDVKSSQNPESLEKLSTTQRSSEESINKKTESPITNVSIVPAAGSNKELGQDDQQLPLGEIMHYRKCTEGYFRNKQGRCRKIRTPPHIPFGITRFATNLASRFRQAVMGDRDLE